MCHFSFLGCFFNDATRVLPLSEKEIALRHLTTTLLNALPLGRCADRLQQPATQDYHEAYRQTCLVFEITPLTPYRINRLADDFFYLWDAENMPTVKELKTQLKASFEDLRTLANILDALEENRENQTPEDSQISLTPHGYP